MENEQEIETAQPIITSSELLDSWLGHRRVTRRLIEAFPEDSLFHYNIGGMRTFAHMAKEIMGVTAAGVKGIITGDWAFPPELDYNAEKQLINTKAELLAEWDKVTDVLTTYWAQITPERFRENVVVFGFYANTVYNSLLYFIDNEIHHRGQGYVYLRSLGIEPPAFWDRS